MYEHKIVVAEDKVIGILQKEGWELVCIYNSKMYFKKEIKKTYNITIDNESPEWIQFITLYRNINTKGSYAKTLIKKYHDTIKKFPHKDMLEKLDQYKRHLDSFTQKPPLQVSTFLNQERYRDEYEITKVDYTEKWKDDMLKEQKVPNECIDAIMTENSAWLSTHGKTREMTAGTFQQIIDKYYTL